MAVVVGRLTALLEAQTAQFEARLAAAGQAVNRITSTTASARQGVMLLRSGMQNLALSGLDMLPPSIARVTAGLSTLLIGSPVVLGVLAGAAAITLAFKAMGDSADRAANAAVKSAEAMRDRILHAARAVPVELVLRRIAETEAQLAALHNAPLPAQRFQEVQTAEGPVSLAMGTPGADRAAQISRLTDFLNQLKLGLNIAGDQAADALHQVTMELERLHQTLLGFTVPPGVGMRLFGHMVSADTGPPVPERDTWAFLREEERQRMRARERMFPNVEMEGALRSRRGGLSPAFAMGTAGALMQGFGGGGIGGFLGGMSGPLAMLGPAGALAGGITGLLGGVFSLFDRSEERRQREAERAAERRHQELLEMLRDTEPVIIVRRDTDWADPREADALARAIRDLRERRTLPAA
jgi:hypothetical protein